MIREWCQLEPGRSVLQVLVGGYKENYGGTRTTLLPKSISSWGRAQVLRMEVIEIGHVFNQKTLKEDHVKEPCCVTTVTSVLDWTHRRLPLISQVESSRKAGVH